MIVETKLNDKEQTIDEVIAGFIREVKGIDLTDEQVTMLAVALGEKLTMRA